MDLTSVNIGLSHKCPQAPQIKSLLVVALVLTLSPVCSATQERRVENALSAEYAAAESSIADLVLHFDPGLSSAIQLALRRDPSVEAARLQAKAAGIEVTAAKWQRFPSVTLETGGFEEDNYQPRTSAVMEQPIWTGGRIKAGIERADSRQRAAYEGYRESRQDIALAVNAAYLDFQRLSQRLSAIEESEIQHQRMVQTMERRVAQEVSPLSDLELARSRLLQVQQQLSLARSQRESALNRLRELLGDFGFMPVDELALPNAWPEMAEADLLQQAMAYSPRRQRYLADASAAAADARIIQAGSLPQISGQYSYSELYGYRLGVVVKAQTDAGFSRFAATDAARMRRDASQMQVGAIERELRDQIRSDLIEYHYASGRIGNAEASAKSTLSITESYMRQFVSGRRSWLDVMNAVRESTSSRLDVIDAQASAVSALNRLLLRSGKLETLLMEIDG